MPRVPWTGRVWAGAGGALALLASFLGCCEPAAATEIWLAAVDPVVRSAARPTSSVDFMQLFEPGASWDAAASQVKVFKISTQFAASAPDDALRTVFSDLRRRRIALALETLVLPRSDRCGDNVEGYHGRPLDKIAARIRDLGGDLRYVAMDEPLFFGSRYAGRNACHDPVEDIARSARPGDPRRVSGQRELARGEGRAPLI